MTADQLKKYYFDNVGGSPDKYERWLELQVVCLHNRVSLLAHEKSAPRRGCTRGAAGFTELREESTGQPEEKR
jgi:hypothetical protein